MPDPINYQLQVQQPFQAAVQGYQAGAAIQQNQFLQNQQQQQQILQMQQQRMQMQRTQSLNQAAAAVAQNPTPQGIAQLSVAFPEMSENFKRSYDMLTPVQQQNKLNLGTQAYAAILSGQPEVAVDVLNREAEAQENAGDHQNAAATRTLANVVAAHPENAKLTLGLNLSAIMGPDKFADTFKSVGPQALQAAQAGADRASTEAAVSAATAPDQVRAAALKNADTQNQIDTRSGQLALDQDKLATDTQTKLTELNMQYGLPDGETRKTINDAATESASADQMASRYNDLAARVDQAAGQLKTGALGATSDAWNKAFGTSNGTTALKQEIARTSSSAAVEQLRSQLGGGGKFTDTDMKVALGNAPSENSDPALISAYFRGQAKLQQLASANAQARAEWLSQVKHLGKAPKDLNVMGTQVPAGTTFSDFARQFIQAKAAGIAQQSGLTQVQGRSYMRFSNPGATDATGSN